MRPLLKFTEYLKVAQLSCIAAFHHYLKYSFCNLRFRKEFKLFYTKKTPKTL